jgi:hypothetical protein
LFNPEKKHGGFEWNIPSHVFFFFNFKQFSVNPLQVDNFFSKVHHVIKLDYYFV